MRHQEAGCTVGLGSQELESWLCDVRHWPAFMVGLESVVPIGGERYVFRIADGLDTYESTVRVGHHPAEHRLTWTSVSGPWLTGEFRLRPRGPHRVDVTLNLSSYPKSLRAGLAEMFLPRLDCAVVDLQRLDAVLLPSAGAGGSRPPTAGVSGRPRP